MTAQLRLFLIRWRGGELNGGITQYSVKRGLRRLGQQESLFSLVASIPLTLIAFEENHEIMLLSIMHHSDTVTRFEACSSHSIAVFGDTSFEGVDQHLACRRVGNFGCTKNRPIMKCRCIGLVYASGRFKREEFEI